MCTEGRGCVCETRDRRRESRERKCSRTNTISFEVALIKKKKTQYVAGGADSVLYRHKLVNVW